MIYSVSQERNRIIFFLERQIWSDEKKTIKSGEHTNNSLLKTIASMKCVVSLTAYKNVLEVSHTVGWGAPNQARIEESVRKKIKSHIGPKEPWLMILKSPA